MSTKIKKATDLIAEGARVRNDGTIHDVDLGGMSERDRSLFMAGWHWQDERLSVIVPMAVKAAKEGRDPAIYDPIAESRVDGPMGCDDHFLADAVEIHSLKKAA